MSDDTSNMHLSASQFMAQRAIAAPTIHVNPPAHYALPGALAPIRADRLKAHQDNGHSDIEIVRYENARFLQANGAIRERHAAWVRRDYDAIVQAHREIEAERTRREAEAAANYQRRLAEIMARKEPTGA